MDNNYRIVRTVESSGAGASCDMHEFKMTPFSNGTTALLTVYQPRQYDLTTNPRFNVERGMGWIVEGVFQEVEIETGRVVFEWRSLDHVDPGLSWTMPGTTDTSGDGLHEQTPWDYFHINSIDKNIEGDYLISARHTSAIYKLSGEDGRIIWQMGGNAATLLTTNFVFAYQHHARWISENSTHTMLSFYDNGSNSFNQTNEFSHGWLVQIDHIAGTATMVKEWGAPEPEGGLSSGSQGNMQILPNGHVHIGWGEHAYFSEHTAEGSAVMYAKVADRASNVMIYRSNKYNWTAQPLTKPALWTYSKEAKQMVFFVSWNGATEVRSWNFYIAEGASGPFRLAGNTKKSGFETEFHFGNVSQWSYAEALDESGRPLETSVIARTFMPSEELLDFCDDRGCGYSEATPDDDVTEYEAQVNIDAQYLSPNRGFNTSHYYKDLDLDLNNTATLVDTDDASRSNSGRTTGMSIMLFSLGLVVGFGITALSFFLYLRGAFQKLEPLADSIQRRTGEFTESVTKSAFGSQFLGKYRRVREREMDGFESGLSSSSSANSGAA